ncbi:MAG: PaaI family thioesterase [Micropruina sp.]|nr:PaaI family thioesterase [Micropruina sp.]
MDAYPDWLLAHGSALDQKMGLEFLEISGERTVARMPVEGNTQPFGLWHGGASCVLAETLGSVAAFSAIEGRGAAFGVDLNATHHKAVRSGWVTGTATQLSLGGRLASYQIVLTDDAGDLVCTARLTVFLRRDPA